TDLLRQTAAAGAEGEAARLKECYELALAELADGAVRPATFLAPADADLPGPGPRAHVVTPDGQERYPALHPRVKLIDLWPGQTVYLDPKGGVMLGASAAPPRVGQEGTFLRLVEGSNLVEAMLQGERIMLYAAQPVLDAVGREELKHGDRLIV